jgi:hypothetical protein
MLRCSGQLVVHDDESVVGCTEEVCGRRCNGNYLRTYHPGSITCRQFVPSGRCRLCGPAPVRAARSPRAAAWQPVPSLQLTTVRSASGTKSGAMMSRRRMTSSQ